MTMDHDSQAGAKSAAGLAFGLLKDLPHQEFRTQDRGFKGALSGMHGSWQHYPVLRSARFGIAPWLMAALVLCLASVALAFNFPPLTGRVVDQANIMSVQSRNDLEAKLKDLENKSGIELVVATVKSLEGSDVETYANELFRNWKLGEAKKNNGVLLLVAPTEHKVRIEVGYGLEGTLTDALSSVIISSAIVPRFKANDFTGGVERGVDGIISVLSGDTTDWQPKPSVRAEDSPQLSNELFSILFLLIVVFVVWSLIRGVRGTSSGRYVRRGGGMIFLPTGGSWGSSGRSGGFGGGGGGLGGGFSGGGGWSGGGGASGSW
jgi:uncharacterized protein